MTDRPCQHCGSPVTRPAGRSGPRPSVCHNCKYVRTCVSCGETRIRPDVSRSAVFTCGDCQLKQRQVVRIHPCPSCRHTTLNSVYCDDCLGLPSRLGIELGLSRAYLYKLLNQKLAENPQLTKRAAFEQIRMERRTMVVA